MCVVVKQIPCKDTDVWLLYKHYAGRLCCRSFCFGIFVKGSLEGIVTYGQPASPQIGRGLLGEYYREYVLELNRLCINETAPKNAASMLVGRSLRMLPKSLAIISYADSSMGHIGYVYQATNWLYVGETVKAKDRQWKSGAATHNRHMYEPEVAIKETTLVERPRKFRYVYFTDKQLKKFLRYPVLPYPKGNRRTRYFTVDISTGGKQEIVINKAVLPTFCKLVSTLIKEPKGELKMQEILNQLTTSANDTSKSGNQQLGVDLSEFGLQDSTEMQLQEELAKLRSIASERELTVEECRKGIAILRKHRVEAAVLNAKSKKSVNKQNKEEMQKKGSELLGSLLG